MEEHTGRARCSAGVVVVVLGGLGVVASCGSSADDASGSGAPRDRAAAEDGAASSGDGRTDSIGPGDGAPADGAPHGSGSDGAPGDGAPGDGAPADGAPHGSGTCGGGFGDPGDFGHIPPCPSDASAWYQRHATSRADYYHDGTHGFEPRLVTWDAALAAVAQKYAGEYSKGASPRGAEKQGWGHGGCDPWDSYWDGTYQGYRAIAGAETPTSCDCRACDVLSGSGVKSFYDLRNGYFRADIVRIDGVSRMGVGHVGMPDGSHYWTAVFAP